MTGWRERLLAMAWVLGVASVALLPDPGAVIPSATYYFRDFTQTFYPLRHFQATELAAGRLPFWNPYVHEGEFMLPSFYPLDLLHVFNSSPEFVSWLLTLHLPLAALGAYALGRERDMSRAAAFAAGSVYSIGGFALSSVNLYTFLQALALAPWVLLALQRSASRGGRWIAAAALALAISLTTLAVEIVGQVVVVGLCLMWARETRYGEPSANRAFARAAAALVLGAGLAGVPIAVAIGVVPETVRGVGFAAQEAGGLSLPPLALLQTVVPSLYMSLARPFEAWWGSTIFLDGPPYFVSIYSGVLALSVAAAGSAAVPRRERVVLIALAALGAWYAIGPQGGLWNLLHELPFANAFRVPAKSLFSVHVALVLLLGHGIDQLRAGRSWRWVAGFGTAGALLVAGIGALSLVSSDAVTPWLQLDARARHEFVAAFPRDALFTAAIAALGAGLAVAAMCRGVKPGLAAMILVGLVVFDLVRAGVGVNRQVPPLYFELLPGVAAEHLDRLDGGRVFAFPATRSRTFRAWLDARSSDADLWAFYAMRQQLDPYSNLIDRIETAASLDRTRFSPLLTGLAWTGHAPEDLAKILPFLRHAGATRITSFDPLEHPELQLFRVVPIARTGLAVHIYAIGEPWPRTRIACGARYAPSRVEAAFAAHQPGFDFQREVVLEGVSPPPSGGCTNGAARTLALTSSDERYEAQTDGAGWLVVRATHARGWHASIDGSPAPVTRADGRHRAVAVPAGRHEVAFHYQPPWLVPALWLSAFAALIAAMLIARGRLGLQGRGARER